MMEHKLDTDRLTSMEKTWMVMYFSFTSLSTVGFGDYEPVSDAERLVGAFVLLFGVAIFSYIMGIFIEILDQFRNMNEDYDQGD
jgi:amino acid permease